MLRQKVKSLTEVSRGSILPLPLLRRSIDRAAPLSTQSGNHRQNLDFQIDNFEIFRNMAQFL